MREYTVWECLGFGSVQYLKFGFGFGFEWLSSVQLCLFETSDLTFMLNLYGSLTGLYMDAI